MQGKPFKSVSLWSEIVHNVAIELLCHKCRLSPEALVIPEMRTAVRPNRIRVHIFKAHLFATALVERDRKLSWLFQDPASEKHPLSSRGQIMPPEESCT